jgi:hypothetical protein
LYDEQDKALTYEVRAAVSHNNCGYAMEAMGDTKNAMKQYETAMKIRQEQWFNLKHVILSEESRRIPLEVANSHDSMDSCYLNQGTL